MNKYCYIAYTAERDRNATAFAERTNPEPDPGYYADVLRIGSNENLCSLLASIGGLKCANVFSSRKEAEAVAQMWNESYKRNGTYFFSVRYLRYSAGRDKCQFYRVDDTNPADMAAQQQLFRDYRAQSDEHPDWFRSLDSQPPYPPFKAVPIREYSGLPF